MDSIIECDDEEALEAISNHDPGRYLREKKRQEEHIRVDREYVEQMQSEFAVILNPFHDEFSLFLRSFQQRALHLNPPQKDLQEQSIMVFSSFGVDISIIITATPDMIDGIVTRYAIDKNVEEKMDAAFQIDMLKAISRNDIGYAMCSDLYDAALQRDWSAAVFSEDRFSQLVTNGVFNRLGRFMGMRVRDLVTAYMYLRVMRIRDFEVRVKALLELYLQGNYPVRILQDKILLIATA